MDLLERVLSASPPPFAILHRPATTGADRVDLLIGAVSTPNTLSETRLTGEHRDGEELLTLVPYRQLAERGFDCVDDGSPLIVLRVTEHEVLSLNEVLARIPVVPLTLADGHFDLDDNAYADIVEKIVVNEIGTGVGSNFVVKRSYVADVVDYRPASALTLFRKLCERESGAYWTFIVHTGMRTFVGATPERHASLVDGVVVMNPISGTYRYPPEGPSLDGLLTFLSDDKESDELHMVVDEELKMMARICEEGGRVSGPHLKEMARLAHVEYFIEGRSTLEPHEILRETLFAPTVVGSPVESACRVIGRYEPNGRGYYSGVLALTARNASGVHRMDSAIMIRTAEIEESGRMRISVGATLVRHSHPLSEAEETRVKAAGLLDAFDNVERPRWNEHPEVRAVLNERAGDLSRFWFQVGKPKSVDADLAGRRVLVVDAEDTFTAMIARQLSSLGLAVEVRRFDEPSTSADHDLVVLGPGPGDPTDLTDPRIAYLDRTIAGLLADRRKFVAVCLSHQLLALRLGLAVLRYEFPNQGVQREIDLFGECETVGFYNTFAARSAERFVDDPAAGVVEISRDIRTGEVNALRAKDFASIQFHAESVLTQEGPRILATVIKEVLEL